MGFTNFGEGVRNPVPERLHSRFWGRLGLLGLTWIAPNPTIDIRNPIAAIIKSTLKVKFCNPSNPSRDFADSVTESLSSWIWGRQSKHPKSPILDFESQFGKKPLRAIRVVPGSKTHFEQSESPEQSESTQIRKLIGFPSQKGFANSVPDSCPESSQTPSPLVGFAGATSE